MLTNLLDFKMFDGISPVSLARIKRLDIKRQEFAGGRLVISKGTSIRHAVFIEKGCLKAVEYMLNGKEIVSSYYFEGDAFPFYLYFGGTSAFPYNSYSVRQTYINLIPLREFEDIMDQDVVLTKNVLKFIAEYTCFNKFVIRATQYPKVEQRIAYWLLHQDEVDDLKFPTTQNMLADILRVNRPSLNQELMRFRKADIIRQSGKKYEVLDPDSLESIIE